MKTIKIFLLALGLLTFGTAQATPIDIDSLFIDSGSVTVDSYWGSGTLSGSFNNPIEITMGEYQNPIVSFSGHFGSYVNIFSTDAYGMPAPSGTVDGSSIDVDFSSLRLDSNFLLHDIPLWPVTTPLDTGFYDESTGEFDLIWTTSIGSGWYSKDITLTLSGYLTTSAVPVPAAVWLFGSGLLGLVGVARRKKS